jgi:short-subunit dehydrogenase
MNSNDRRPRALITGASGGIGRELAIQCAAGGHDCVLVARNAHALNELAVELAERHQVTSIVIPIDLARPEAPAELEAELERRGLVIDVLMNNAGFANHGPLVTNDLRVASELMQVNIVALTLLTRRLLPGMLVRRQGRILNVASTAAFQPGPYMAIYYASKAYVLNFTEAIAEELTGSGVTATALCPGPTTTGFQERAKLGGVPLFTRSILASGDPQAVAEAGYRGMMAGKRVVVPGFRNQVHVFATRFLPRKTLAQIVSRVQSRIGDSA